MFIIFALQGQRSFRVINRLRNVFVIKFEEVAEFQYIGLVIKKKGEKIKLGLNRYVKKRKYIRVETGRNWKDAISTRAITETRQIISQQAGHLNQNWSKLRC